MQVWNLLMAVVLLIEAPLLPLQLGFLPEEDEGDHPWWMWLNCWVDVVLWWDIVLQFFVQVQSNDRSYWMGHIGQIAALYSRSAFLLDLCSVLPIKRMLSSDMAPSAPRLLRPVLRLVPFRCCLSMVGFHKLLRFSRIGRVRQSLRSSMPIWMHFTYAQNTLLKSFLAVLFSTHVMGCMWAGLSLCCEDDGHSNWFEFLATNKIGASLYTTGNMRNIYITALYWSVFTITGVGYGDVAPVKPVEYVAATLCMFVGSLLWAWVVANMVTIRATMNQAENDHLQTLDCINALLRDNQVKKQLGRRLREYFTKMKDVREHDFIGGLVNRLSPELRTEVVFTIHQEWIGQIWWLAKIPVREFVTELARKMTASLHAPNEFIQQQQELSVIRKGLCIHGGSLMARGQVFGQDMLLDNEALRKPYATLVLTFLHLLVLTKRKLVDTVAEHPEVEPSIRKSYVILVVIRGILFRAAQLKRRQQLAEPRAGTHRAMSALDPSKFTKPFGDVEDVPLPPTVSRSTAIAPLQDPWGPEATDPHEPGPAHGSRRRSFPSTRNELFSASQPVGALPAGLSEDQVSSLVLQFDETEAELRDRMTRLEESALKLADQLKLLRNL